MMDEHSRREHLRHWSFAAVAGLLTSAEANAATSHPSRLLERYVRAWESRSIDAILGCMDPGIGQTGPNVATIGVNAYRASTLRFLDLLEGVSARAQAVLPQGGLLWWDFECRHPIGRVVTGELVSIRNNRIVTSELVFDPRSFALLSANRAKGE